MKPQDLLEIFGTQTAIAEALGICQSNVSKWLKAGEVPALRQLQLEAKTKGALKAEKNILKPKSSPKSIKVN